MASYLTKNIPQICVEVLIFVIISLCFQVDAARDRDDDDFIARDVYGDFLGDSDSSNRYIVDFSSSQKEDILKLHNELRNKLALGRIDRFSSATRMPALKWNNELARLAKLDARSCVYGNDECRTKEKSRHGGQNIGRHGITSMYEEPPMQAATNIITDWFLEYKNAADTNSHPQGYEPNRRETMEFTVMVNDRYTNVGCALIRNKEDGLKYYFMVCNYGYINSNSNRKPVYERGSSGSKCREQHPDYEGLCRTSGYYNYDNIDNNGLFRLFF